MGFSLFHDELHVLPRVHTLATVWIVCVATYVALRLLWLGLTMPRKTKVDGCKPHGRIVAWTWQLPPWMVRDKSTTPRWSWSWSWSWLLRRAGLYRVTVWTRVARRAGYATLLVAVVIVGFNSTMLYLRTGSWVQQPYEWYSLQATGLRVFSKSVSLPSAILDTCLAPSKVSPANATLLTMDDVLPATIQKTLAEPTVVYVVPFGWNGVVTISEAQATTGIQSAHEPHNAVLRKPMPLEYTRVAPVDALTMFPYVWHSMLSTSFSDKVQVVSPWERRIEKAQLSYQLVHSQEQLDNLQPGSNVFAIVQGMANVLRLADALPAASKLGYIALSKEDCNNPHAEQYTSHPAIRFGLFPYGDCSLVDNDRFSVVPLGPSFEHGFPLNTHRTRIPLVEERTQLLNLMVSWTVEKPTRIQAMIAALDVCESSLATGRGCVIEHNDLAFKALQKIDTALGLDLRWALSSAPDVYVEHLKRSVFTLCPFGKNPEQYRIWEALAAGSIPIVEDMPAENSDEHGSFTPGQFFHPSYPSTWKCRPAMDVHGFLRNKQAPVVFVTDWKRDLPRVLRYYTADHPEELAALQLRTQQWYRDMGEHLQADFVAKSLRHFQ